MKPRERIVPKWHEKPYEWNQVSEKKRDVCQAACPRDGAVGHPIGYRGAGPGTPTVSAHALCAAHPSSRPVVSHSS